MKSHYKYFTLLQGYLVNWDIQKTVWDYVFGKDVFNVNHSNTTMIVTEPYLNFTSTQEALCEIFFEEYEVDALLRINGNYECSHTSVYIYSFIQGERGHTQSSVFNGKLNLLTLEKKKKTRVIVYC